MAKLPRLFSRALRLTVVLMILAALLLLGGNRSTAQEEYGAISGTVTLAPGTSAEYVRVHICRADSPTCEEYASTSTAPGQVYTVGWLPAGTYKVWFRNEHFYPASIANMFYGDAFTVESASVVTVTAGETTPGISAEVSQGGTITGTVRGFANMPVHQANVYACFYYSAGECTLLGSNAYTDEAGAYRLDRLPKGPIYVRFETPYNNPVYLTHYLGGASEVSEATAVTLARDEFREDVDTQFPMLPHIGGRIVDEAGVGISHQYVEAHCVSEDCALAVGFSDSSGYYAIPVETPGSYILFFNFDNDWDVRYPNQFWPNVPAKRFAEKIVLSAGQSFESANAVKYAAASISGVVTNGNPDVHVCWWSGTACDSPIRTYTDESGHYTATGLLAGNYKVLFIDHSQRNESEFYADAGTLASATIVMTTAGVATPNIDATLAPAAGPYVISGVVTDGTTGLANIDIYVCRGMSMYCDEHVTTDASGAYSYSTDAPSVFSVQFRDPNGIYLQQFYAGAADQNEAEPVVVRTGQELNSINAQLSKGVVLEGSVVDNLGNPINGINVHLCRIHSWGCGDSIVYSNPDGNTYRFADLPGGSFRLFFTATNGGYEDRYFDNVRAEDKATPITLANGESDLGRVIVLPRLAQVSGKVTDSAGRPLWNITVEAETYNCFDCGYAYVSPVKTGTDGMYRLEGLVSANYKIRFSDEASNYITRWYGGDGAYENSTTVPVAPSANVTGIDVQMKAYGAISGRVTNSSGAPISGTSVELCRVDTQTCVPWPPLPSAYTNANGEYELTRIAPGKWHLRFAGFGDFPDPTGYVPEFYNDASTRQEAEVLTIGDNTRLTGINAVLLRRDETPTPPATPTVPVTQTPSGTPTIPVSPTIPPTSTSPATPPAPAPTRTPTPTIPANPGPDAIAEIAVQPGGASTTIVPFAAGQSVQISVPAGAVLQPTTLRFFTNHNPPAGATTSFRLGNLAFSISAEQSGNDVNGLAFAIPVTLRITYRDEDVEGLVEELLELRWYDAEADAWRSEGIRVIERDLVNRVITVEIDHLTDFALGDGSQSLFLPSVQAQR